MVAGNGLSFRANVDEKGIGRFEDIKVDLICKFQKYFCINADCLQYDFALYKFAND